MRRGGLHRTGEPSRAGLGEEKSSEEPGGLPAQGTNTVLWGCLFVWRFWFFVGFFCFNFFFFVLQTPEAPISFSCTGILLSVGL